MDPFCIEDSPNWCSPESLKSSLHLPPDYSYLSTGAVLCSMTQNLAVQSPVSPGSSSLTSQTGSIPPSPDPRTSSNPGPQLSSTVSGSDGLLISIDGHTVDSNSHSPSAVGDRLAPSHDFNVSRSPIGGPQPRTLVTSEPTFMYQDVQPSTIHEDEFECGNNIGSGRDMEVDEKPNKIKPAPGGGLNGANNKTTGSNNFVNKLFSLVDDRASSHYINWTELGTSFVVTNVAEFSRDVLGNHFKHNNFSSFVRQLNMYGFHKTNRNPRANRGSNANENHIWEFQHPKFQRGRPELLEQIRRKEGNGSGPSPSPIQPSETSPSCAVPSSSPGVPAMNARLDALSFRCQRLEEQNSNLIVALQDEKLKTKKLYQIVGGIWKFLEQDPKFHDFLQESGTPEQINYDIPVHDTGADGQLQGVVPFDRNTMVEAVGLGLGLAMDANPPIVVTSPNDHHQLSGMPSLTIPTNSQPHSQLFSPHTPSPHSSPSSPYPPNQQTIGRSIGHCGHGHSGNVAGQNLTLSTDFQLGHRLSHSLPDSHLSPATSPYMNVSSPLSTSPGALDQGSNSPHLAHHAHSRSLGGHSPVSISRPIGHGHSQSLQVGDVRVSLKRPRLDDTLEDYNIGQLNVNGLSPTRLAGRHPRPRSISASNIGSSHNLSLNIQTTTGSWGSQPSPLLGENDIDGRPMSAVSANGSAGFGTMGDMQQDN